jgi:hypothetical protein
MKLLNVQEKYPNCHELIVSKVLELSSKNEESVSFKKNFSFPSHVSFYFGALEPFLSEDGKIATNAIYIKDNVMFLEGWITDNYYELVNPLNTII